MKCLGWAGGNSEGTAGQAPNRNRRAKERAAMQVSAAGHEEPGEPRQGPVNTTHPKNWGMESQANLTETLGNLRRESGFTPNVDVRRGEVPKAPDPKGKTCLVMLMGPKFPRDPFLYTVPKMMAGNTMEPFLSRPPCHSFQ